MNTIEQVLEGCRDLEIGATLKITGLVSSDETVSDVTVTLLPPDGYKAMQQEDWDTLSALRHGDLEAEEVAAAIEMIVALDKALTPAGGPASSRGPQYEREPSSPVYRLPSSPDSVYFLRLRKEGPVEGGKPPKGALPLAKFMLARKLQLQTVNYVHAVKLTDGKFESVQIV